MTWAILERTDLIKDDERYGRLSSLRPTYVTKVVDMLDTVRRLTVRTISADLHTFRFTVQKTIRIKKKCLCVKVLCVVWYQARRIAYDINYAPNFEKVDGAYCFWSVRACVRGCVRHTFCTYCNF